MPNVNFYPGGGRSPLGGQVNRIPYVTAKPYDIITPASARYKFAADMVRALTAKGQENREREDRDVYMAALSREKEFDPSTMPPPEESNLLAGEREIMAQALLAGEPSLGISEKDVFPLSTDSPDPRVAEMFSDGASDRYESIKRAASEGIPTGYAASPPLGTDESMIPPPYAEGFSGGPEALFGADGASDPRMQAALIGDIGTRAGDLQRHEDALKAAEANFVGRDEAMAAYDPTTKYGEELKYGYQVDQVGRDIAEEEAEDERVRVAELLRQKRVYEKGVAEDLAKANFLKAGLTTASSLKPTKPVTFDMRDSEETRLELGLAEGSEGTYRYKQDPTSGAYTLERIGSAVEDNNEGSRSKLLSLYKAQTGLEEMLVDMDREKVPGNNPERMRIANRLKVLKDIIAKDAQVLSTGAYYKEGGKQKVPRDALEYKQAQDAVVDLERDENLIRLLHKGKATTGFAAEWIQTLNKTVNFFKDDKRLAEGITDTQLVDVLTGEQVFPLIQALGIGARGMDTPNEREFMRKVLTGTLTLTKDTLLHMARMRQKQSLGAIKNWNTRVDRGEVSDYLEVNKISKENSRIQNPYTDQNRITAINEMDLNQVTQYMHIGLPEKVKEAILARIRALK